MNYYSQESKDNNIVNEGFLYIDNRNHDIHADNTMTLTFQKGKIVDMNEKTVCCGEILPIMDYEEFEVNKDKIKHYSLKLKGTQIRVYKHSEYTNANQSNVMISLESVIYPHDLIMSEEEIRDQINYELIEEGKCYYAVITPDKQIILTYITEISNPKLEVPTIVLSQDKAFRYHVEIKNCTDENETAMETFTNKLNKNKEEYGIVFYRNDGQRFEFWSTAYHQFKNYKRPYNMPYPNYYVLLLNKYPLGSDNYIEFFKDLHYDIELYLKDYPEDIEIFNLMKKRLNICVCRMQEEYYKNNTDQYQDQYKDQYQHQGSVDEDEITNQVYEIRNEKRLKMDKLKINIIKEMLCIDKDYDCVPENVVNQINKKNETRKSSE